ncbi:MAG: Hpt domain-containing protein [Chloroflexota bacterium]
MVLDTAAIQILFEYTCDDDLALFNELVDDYLGDSSHLLVELASASEHKDFPVLHRIAHTLKGQSATFGAETFAEICLKIEQIAKAGTLEGIDRLIDDLNSEYGDVKTTLLAEIQHLGSSH